MLRKTRDRTAHFTLPAPGCEQIFTADADIAVNSPTVNPARFMRADLWEITSK